MSSLAPSTVVLMHSSGSSSRQWDMLAESLRPTHRVVALDFHGHGLRFAQSCPAGSCVEHDAALAEPLLAEAGAVHLIGHSYGGAVALQLAAAHPRRVRSVAIFEPVLFRLLIDDDVISPAVQELFATVDAIAECVGEYQPREAARRFVEYWAGAPAWHAMPAGRQRAIAARMHTVLGHFRALFGAPSPHRLLERLSMPVLCLTGADTVASTWRIGELLSGLLRTALHETLPGMGHMGPLTHAERVNRRLRDFLAAQAASDAASRLERVAA